MLTTDFLLIPMLNFRICIFKLKKCIRRLIKTRICSETAATGSTVLQSNLLPLDYRRIQFNRKQTW